MGDTKNVINENTIIQISPKILSAFFVGLLSILWGFYTLVFAPDVVELREAVKSLQDVQKNLEIQVGIQKTLNEQRSQVISPDQLDLNN